MGELYKQLAAAELKSQLYRKGYRKAKASVTQTGTMKVPTTITPVTAPVMTSKFQQWLLLLLLLLDHQ